MICHGMHKQLLLDYGVAFLSNLVYKICRLLGVKKINTSAYYPQGDELVEMLNRTLLDMLSKSVVLGSRSGMYGYHMCSLLTSVLPRVLQDNLLSICSTAVSLGSPQRSFSHHLLIKRLLCWTIMPCVWHKPCRKRGSLYNAAYEMHRGNRKGNRIKE